MRAWSGGALYRVFTHMPDGVAWCVCCELLIDPERSASPGNQQTATPHEHTCLLAFLTMGIPHAEMLRLVESAPGSQSLLGQWEPDMEARP